MHGVAVYDAEIDIMHLPFFKIPGDQLVPRAELYALVQGIRRFDDPRTYAIFVDASYDVDVIDHFNDKHDGGANRDLWTHMRECQQYGPRMT